MRASWLALVLVACGGPEQPAVPPPGDPVDRFAVAPEEVLDEVAAMTDPVAQEIVVLALLEAYPGQTGALCERLRPGPVQERCTRYNERPHLWTIPTETPAAAGSAGAPGEAPPPGSGDGEHPLGPPLTVSKRLGGGPANVRQLLPEIGLSPVVADPGSCPPERPVCLEQEAERLSGAGKADLAAARCAALADDRGRQDCYFRAAEALPAGNARYPTGVELCGRAGSFGPECHGHVILAMSTDAGRPFTEEGDALATVRAARIEAYWAERDPDFGALAVDQFWSTWLGWQELPEPEGFRVSADRLPAAAAPHVRAALAFRVSEAPTPVAAADQWWSGAGPILPVVPLDHVRQAMLWVVELPGEEQIPAAYLAPVAGGRRPTSERPSVDLKLALIEVLARREPARVDAIALLAKDKEWVVRWSVARVLGHVEPDHPARAALIADRHPLVRTRASWTPGAAVPGDEAPLPPPRPERTP